MKFHGKHRAAGSAPRNGAAALMIGGLVAGTVATAGATTLKDNSTPDAVAGIVSGDLATAVPQQERQAAGDRAASAPSMHSASLSELRDQVAADRSQARSAPADAADISTVLESSAFSGRALEVQAVEDTVATPAESSTEEAAPAQEEAAPAQQQAAPAQQQAAPAQQQAAPAQQQAAPQQSAPVQPQAAPQQSAPVQPQAAPQPAAAPAPVAGGSIVGIASQYVGYPYVLGGTPPSTFDCSSFTWWVYQQAGIDIPRTVSGQMAAVTPVSNPQPGDLIFTNQFYHVGIYAGNGMAVEALNPGSGVTYGAPVYGGIWYGRITG